MDNILSIDDAKRFLESIGIHYNEKKQKNDPLGLLNEIILSFHYNIPFQNVTLLAKPLSLRATPTWAEIKEEVTSKRGGLCYTCNCFMKCLLDSLGYSAYHVSSSIQHDNNHIITVVEIHGKKYLVEVGVGYPTFEAIPLDFGDETPVFNHSFLHYKFVRQSETVIVRMHKKSTGFASEEFKDGEIWRENCVIDLTPRDVAFFNGSMSVVYQVPTMTPFHNSLRIVSYSENGTKAFKDKLYFEESSDTHCLVVNEEVGNLDKLVEKIKTLYPVLSVAASSMKTELSWID